MKRVSRVDRDLPTLKDVRNHSKRAFTPDESAAYKMWRMLYTKYENEKENFDFKEVDDACIYFDLNTKAGPKIGISRRDRLARHKSLGIFVPQNVMDMIEDVDWVSDYVYGERPHCYMSRLIDTIGPA